MYLGKGRYYDIITEIIFKLVSFQIHSEETNSFSFHFEITDYNDIFSSSLAYGIHDHSMYIGSCT